MKMKKFEAFKIEAKKMYTVKGGTCGTESETTLINCESDGDGTKSGDWDDEGCCGA